MDQRIEFLMETKVDEQFRILSLKSLGGNRVLIDFQGNEGTMFSIHGKISTEIVNESIGEITKISSKGITKKLLMPRIYR